MWIVLQPQHTSVVFISFNKPQCPLRCGFGLVALVVSLISLESVFPTAEGPCLVHTITGDLLRALEGPENCLFPRLISVSSEGHCIIYYERGRFSNFSINGKLLAQMEINDSTRVSTHQCWAAKSHGSQTYLTSKWLGIELPRHPLKHMLGLKACKLMLMNALNKPKIPQYWISSSMSRL